jgi:hypothetical protein
MPASSRGNSNNKLVVLIYVSACVATGVAVVFALAGLRNKKRKRLKALEFVSWRDAEALEERKEERKILVVDTTHATRECLTHHKMRYAPPPTLRSDTTTAMVLKAIAQRHEVLSSATGVTVDHFDIDAFLSVFSACNPQVAETFSDVIREAAHIGDFRELDLSRPGAQNALKVCCWLNSLERQLFSRPFEGGDEKKWPYFLGDGRFASFLHALHSSADAQRHLWGAEYDKVMADLNILNHGGQVRRYNDIGLVVVEAPTAVHYYALFSVSRGCDTVLSSYPASTPPSITVKRCHEIEQKYTQYVNLESRDTWYNTFVCACVLSMLVHESDGVFCESG